MGLKLSARMASASDWEGSYEFDQSRVAIGRSVSSDVQLPDATVSTFHATIRVQGSGYGIVDENSANGVFVNKERIAAGRPKVLRSGDHISIGLFLLEVQIGAVVTLATSADKTAALARQFVREALGESLPPCRFTILNGPDQNSSLELPSPPSTLTIGRGDSCSLQLNDADSSREHAELNVGAFGVTIRDLDSKNGIEVNGQPVVQRMLRDRDEVLIGATMLVFEEPSQQAMSGILELPDAPVMAESLTAWENLPSPDDDDSRTEIDLESSKESSEEPSSTQLQSTTGEPSLTTEDLGKTDSTDTSVQPPVTTHRPSKHMNADFIIYAMAALIVAISIAGLFWLFATV